MNLINKIITIVFTVALPSMLSASVITASDMGWYDETGHHSSSNPNYLVGDLGGKEYRNWMTFDMSNVGTVSSAILRAYLIDIPPGSQYGYNSNDPFETWSLWDVSGSTGSLTGGTGGVAMFNDLGSGISYGSVDATFADVGSYIEVSLNADALAALSASSGIWGIGGSITTLGSIDEGLYWYSHEDARVELVINSVPEPATFILLGLGLVGACFFKKKEKGLI